MVVGWLFIVLPGLLGGPNGGNGRNSGVGKLGLRGGNLLGLVGYISWLGLLLATPVRGFVAGWIGKLELKIVGSLSPSTD